MSLESKTFTRVLELETIGKSLTLHQCEVGTVGCVVWDAGIVLAKYLENEYSSRSSQEGLNGLQILDLGAGTGVVGLTAACIGAHSILTDLPEILPLLELNVQTNQSAFSGSARAEVFKWGSEVSENFRKTDIIIVADCVYYEECSLLVDTLSTLCNEKVTILLSYENRESEVKVALQKKFWKLIDERGFEVHEIPFEDHHPVFRSKDIHIVRLTRKKQN